MTDDSVIVSYAVTDRHGRPGGTLAGPVMMSLADTSAWIAIMSQIGPVVLAVTTSLHIDFLRKPQLTDLMARTRMLKLGKTTRRRRRRTVLARRDRTRREGAGHVLHPALAEALVRRH